MQEIAIYNKRIPRKNDTKNTLPANTVFEEYKMVIKYYFSIYKNYNTTLPI